MSYLSRTSYVPFYFLRMLVYVSPAVAVGSNSWPQQLVYHLHTLHQLAMLFFYSSEVEVVVVVGT